VPTLNVRPYTERPYLAICLPGVSLSYLCIYSRHPGLYCGLRLLPGKALDAALRPPLALTRLAETLLGKPPYELRWMQGHPLKVSEWVWTKGRR
jgi:hypothetical protein